MREAATQSWTSAELLSQLVRNKAKTCYAPRKAATAFLMEKLLPVILFGLYVVFKGRLQECLPHLEESTSYLGAKTLGGGGRKKWKSNVLQLKSQQQLYVSQISAFIFHTWVIRDDCDFFFFGLWSIILHKRMNIVKVTFHRRVNAMVWVGDDCLRRLLFSSYAHIPFAHAILASASPSQVTLDKDPVLYISALLFHCAYRRSVKHILLISFPAGDSKAEGFDY